MSLWRVLSYPFKSRSRRPLAARRPDRAEMGQSKDVPLGMEAIDMSIVQKASLRNDALEKATTAFRTPKGFFQGMRSTYVAPMPEDENYAARYHRAYNKKGNS